MDFASVACSPMGTALNGMKAFQVIASITVLIVAIGQWYGIGEKIIHAIDQWQHFAGYSNNGYTTLSYELTGFTYIASTMFIALSIFTSKTTKIKPVKVVSGAGCAMLCIGLISLTALIISPLGELVSR